jgi:Putative Ig domain
MHLERSAARYRAAIYAVVCSLLFGIMTFTGSNTALAGDSRSWTHSALPVPTHDWKKVAVAQDQVHLAAVDNGGDIWLGQRINPTGGSGKNVLQWIDQSQTGAPRNKQWTSVDLTIDGRQIVATEDHGPLWLSNDFGATWETKTIQTSADPAVQSSNNWIGVAASNAASNPISQLAIIAATSDGQLWRSYNDGAGWTQIVTPGVSNWSTLQTSSTGISLIDLLGNVYFSFSPWQTSDWTGQLSLIKKKTTYPHEDIHFSQISTPQTQLFAIPKDGSSQLIRVDGLEGAYPSLATVSTLVTPAVPKYITNMWGTYQSGGCGGYGLIDQNNVFYQSSFDDTTGICAFKDTFAHTWIDKSTGTAVEGKHWSSVTTIGGGSSKPHTFLLTTVEGQMWTYEPGKNKWSSYFDGLASMASSNDGQKVFVAANGGPIFKSTDGGTTWASTTDSIGEHLWSQLSVSTDGQKIAAAEYGGSVWTSSDSGVTWTKSASPSNGWTTLKLSTDGTHIVGGGEAGWNYDGYLFKSANFGVSWETVTTSIVSSSAALSDDGVAIYGICSTCTDATTLGNSVDGGTHWWNKSYVRTGNKVWRGIATSKSGAKLVAVADNAQIYTSNHFGYQWNEPTGDATKHWNSVAMTPDGTKIVAGASPGDIYTSFDFGATWQDHTGANGTWRQVFISGDGNTVYGLTGTEIWKSRLVLAPSLALSIFNETAYQNTPMAPIIPSNYGGPGTFTIVPALPAGVMLDPDTGIVSGSPSTIQSPINYTLTATNDSGSSSKIFSLAVEETYVSRSRLVNVHGVVKTKDGTLIAGATVQYLADGSVIVLEIIHFSHRQEMV